MVRPLIKELINEEMLEMIQLTQGLISSVIYHRADQTLDLLDHS